ncbi:MAG TPA: hypothetical protein VFS67_30560 [Polyangiaceae bacterium]|jgi:hypothetical protein|nr:hypothetical protein [Polyangiaceae bacterium]
MPNAKYSQKDFSAEPESGEWTSVQPIVRSRPERRTIPVGALEYHLFSPQRARDPLLEQAYELWHDVWRATFEELDGAAELFSDEFCRQDEIGVLATGGCCLSVTGIRWLDMSLARARSDSYFRHWPREAIEKLGRGLVLVTSNTVVHPDWRGSMIAPPRELAEVEPSRLAFTTIAMSIRRLLASPAESATGLSRNDRAMDRVSIGLGGVAIGRIRLHGEDTNVMHFPRSLAKPEGPVVDHLWSRRHQG